MVLTTQTGALSLSGSTLSALGGKGIDAPARVNSLANTLLTASGTGIAVRLTTGIALSDGDVIYAGLRLGTDASNPATFGKPVTATGALANGPDQYIASGGSGMGISAESGATAWVNVDPTTGLATGRSGTIVTYGPDSTGTARDSAGISATGNTTINVANEAIQTRGANAYGAQAQSGAKLDFTRGGSSIVTTGDSARGLYATGSSGSTASTIDATSLSVSTSGAAAHGAFAISGGAITLNGGSITTSGQQANAINANGGSVSATNTTINTSGAGSRGAFAVAGAQVTLSGGAITVTGTAAGTASAFGIYSGSAASVQTSNVNVTTSAAGTRAVFADTGSGITLNGGTIRVEGSDTIALGTNGAGSRITASNLVVQATNTNGRGFEATGGGAIDLSGGGNSVTTAGNTGHGVHASGIDTVSGTASSINGANLAVQTSGAGAHGIFADLGAQITLGASVTVTTNGDAAIGLDANGDGSLVKAGNAQVTTTGASSWGGFATRGVLDLSSGGAAITTSGTQSYGLFAVNPGGTVIAANATVSTSGLAAHGAAATLTGSLDLTNVTISTTGNGAAGIALQSAGTTLLSGGGNNVATTGAGADGIYVFGGASVGFSASNPLPVLTVSGAGSALLHVDGSGSAASLTGVTLANSGTYSGITGALVSGAGTLTLNNATVNMSGGQSIGVEVRGAGSTLVSRGTSAIVTSGVGSDVLLVSQGASVTLDTATTRPTISTTGANSTLLHVDGAGSTATLRGITLSNPNTTAGVIGVRATGAGLATLDQVNAVTTGTGLYAVGAGSRIVGTNLAVSTLGASGHGAWASGGGRIDLDPTTIITSGTGAYGLLSDGSGSIVTSSGDSIYTGVRLGTNAADLTTYGKPVTSTGALATDPSQYVSSGASAAYGVLSQNGGAVWLNVDPSTSAATSDAGIVRTLGSDSDGLRADGAGSTIAAANETVTTNGVRSPGVHALNGGAINLIGGSVTTTNTSGTGAFANGLFAESGGTVTASGVDVVTNGSRSFGVQADTGGTVNLTGSAADRSTVTTLNANSVGLTTSSGTINVAYTDVASGSHGAIAELTGQIHFGDGGSTITTANPNVVGLGANLGGIIDATGPITVNMNAASASTTPGRTAAYAHDGGQIALAAGSVFNINGGAGGAGMMVDNSVLSRSIDGLTINLNAVGTTSSAGSSGVVAINGGQAAFDGLTVQGTSAASGALARGAGANIALADSNITVAAQSPNYYVLTGSGFLVLSTGFQTNGSTPAHGVAAWRWRNAIGGSQRHFRLLHLWRWRLCAAHRRGDAVGHGCDYHRIGHQWSAFHLRHDHRHEFHREHHRRGHRDSARFRHDYARCWRPERGADYRYHGAGDGNGNLRLLFAQWLRHDREPVHHDRRQPDQRAVGRLGGGRTDGHRARRCPGAGAGRLRCLCPEQLSAERPARSGGDAGQPDCDRQRPCGR
ncbi:hypothetical protein WBP06_24495 [Novosphingobium sp. BL-8H]|uniref:beta strand repeat-containing protein n=1 Tax=Novosphingobium sp. BL-8H TaxID=3127640 RepID=UPI0037582C15